MDNVEILTSNHFNNFLWSIVFVTLGSITLFYPISGHGQSNIEFERLFIFVPQRIDTVYSVKDVYEENMYIIFGNKEELESYIRHEREKGNIISEYSYTTDTIPSFYISKTPVSQVEYLTYCRQAKKKAPKGFFRTHKPALNISSEDMEQYCRYLSRKRHIPVRLPRYREWNSENGFYITMEERDGKKQLLLTRLNKMTHQVYGKKMPFQFNLKGIVSRKTIISWNDFESMQVIDGKTKQRGIVTFYGKNEKMEFKRPNRQHISLIDLKPLLLSFHKQMLQNSDK